MRSREFFGGAFMAVYMMDIDECLWYGFAWFAPHSRRHMSLDKRPSGRVASDAGRVLRSSSNAKKDKELEASILANREPAKPARADRSLAELFATRRGEK
jgi:hypothetical protein